MAHSDKNRGDCFHLLVSFKQTVNKFGMDFLCNTSHSFADLVINYLNLIKERSSCLEEFCKKGVLRSFTKFVRTPFFKE